MSVLLFADGRDYALMPPARDHKRIGENDTGPNTGGMGAITDASVLENETLTRIVREVVEPTLNGARQEGFPFRGVLFVGLMLTATGPKVLEYNVRFGDPETQAILVRLKSDLFRVFDAITVEGLRDVKVEWTQESSLCGLASRLSGFVSKWRTNQHGPADTSNQLQVTAGTAKSEAGEFPIWQWKSAGNYGGFDVRPALAS